jgi:hypothetical protein
MKVLCFLAILLSLLQLYIIATREPDSIRCDCGEIR